ncbi:hypothetical protein HU200_039596 [Digitaria exilis]|uniref:EF-hand domain-containing protein n=1 Tax=Digitaria exilis TaxID=1010633 RepID=A0A835BGC4_9POAL|nr:hypothetical protein HU200_039596 [Digitaria exilis]
MAWVFRNFDANSDGRILRFELVDVFESLGHAASNDGLAHMMAETDADDFISLDEFTTLNAPPLSSSASPGAWRVRLHRTTHNRGMPWPPGDIYGPLC